MITAVAQSREDEVRERFEINMAKHRMHVLHDHGLYRHLRFCAPRTWTYGYDLITWPGYLAIAGDCGDYTFARTRDMFEFFRMDGGRINPDYWSEKLTNNGMRDATRQFAPETFRQRVADWIEDQVKWTLEDKASHRRTLNDRMPKWSPYSREEALAWLREYEQSGVAIFEPELWSFDDWDWQFLFCCWAIVQGIAQYDWRKGWR